MLAVHSSDARTPLAPNRYLTDMKQRVLQALEELQREAHVTAARQRSNHPPAISMRAIAARAGESALAVHLFSSMG